MSGVLRFSVLRLVQASSCSPLLTAKSKLPTIQITCGISGKAIRKLENVKRIPPYDYVNKPYGMLQAIFDKTTKRFDDNSKIIVVEGPMAAGKSTFAKGLADELEMLYVPEANMDLMYINPYGYDMRKLDPELPEMVKSFDLKKFCENPNHRLAATYQIRQYMMRYSQYIDALAHVLSTGQGVVLDRSCYSDYVFLEAMYRANYVSRPARSVYYQIRENTIHELMKPHLVIYLDVPVECVKQNIKARNIDYEVNSKVFTDEYLKNIDQFYKQKYLKEANISSELLVYDWSNGGDPDIVVEDIERIDFDRFDKHDPKLKEWRLPNEWEWCETRMKYGSEKDVLMNYFNVPRYDVPELVMSGEDQKIWHEVWYNAPGMKYMTGYNEDMGDTGILTKTSYDRRNN